MVVSEKKRYSWKRDRNICDNCGRRAVSWRWSSYNWFYHYNFCSFTCYAITRHTTVLWESLIISIGINVAIILRFGMNLTCLFICNLSLIIPIWIYALVVQVEWKLHKDNVRFKDFSTYIEEDFQIRKENQAKEWAINTSELIDYS